MRFDQEVLWIALTSRSEDMHTSPCQVETALNEKKHKTQWPKQFVTKIRTLSRTRLPPVLIFGPFQYAKSKPTRLPEVN